MSLIKCISVLYSVLKFVKINFLDQEAPGSPTTGAEAPGLNTWTSVKCVFCDAVLVLNDQPRLLECLHTACSPCVSAKLNEPNQDPGDVVGKLI